MAGLGLPVTVLGVEDAVKIYKGCVSLNRDLCWVDALAFEVYVKQAELGNGRDAGSGSEDRAVALYAGPFLGLDAIPHWADPYREDLRRRFVHLTPSPVQTGSGEAPG